MLCTDSLFHHVVLASVAMSDNEDATKEEKEIEELTNELKTNPQQYEKHVQLIELLRSSGELEALKQARDHMNSVFPLSPTLWLEYIKDEEEMGSEEGVVLSLWNRAVADYPGSFDLWQEFCMRATGFEMPADDVRGIFERALTAVGLNASKGALIWGIYRDFEQAILLSMEELKSSSEDEDAQRSRLEKLFRRQVVVPMNGLETAMEEYRTFLGLEASAVLTDAALLRHHDGALEKLKVLQEIEDQLEAADESKASPALAAAFGSYVERERSWSDHGRIRSIYERALVPLCLDPTLWTQYTTYLDRDLLDRELACEVYARAVRNCSWVGELWRNYMLALERAGRDFDQIETVFRVALKGGFTTAYEGVQLHLTYVYSLRRHAKSHDAMSLALSEGAATLRHSFPYDWDVDCTYRRLWARFAAHNLQQMDKAREIWDEILKEQGNGRFAQVWLEYSRLERQYGETQRCRRLLFKAVNSVTDYPEQVCQSLLEFEQEEGTLEQLDVATERVDAQLKRIRERQTRGEVARQKGKKPPAKRQDNVLSPPKQSAPKRKAPKEQEEVKPQVNGALEKSAKDKDGFAVPTLPGAPVTKKSRMDDGSSGGELPNTSSAEVKVEKSSVKMETNVNENKMKNNHVEIAASGNNKTIFVSNLNYKTTEEQLRKQFESVGEISAVRFAGISGRHKGFGYIDFTDPTCAQNALKLDRTMLAGRPMYVSEFRPKNATDITSSTAPPGFRHSVTLERNKLFVRNLPLDATQAEVAALFDAYGATSVRLVTWKTGTSKGIAYVDFPDAQTAATALQRTDQTVFMSQTLEVAISHPPARRTMEMEAPSERGARLPPKLSLVPAAALAAPRSTVVSDKTAPATETAASNAAHGVGPGGKVESTAQNAKMNNEDFRKRFLKD